MTNFYSRFWLRSLTALIALAPIAAMAQDVEEEKPVEVDPFFIIQKKSNITNNDTFKENTIGRLDGMLAYNDQLYVRTSLNEPGPVSINGAATDAEGHYAPYEFVLGDVASKPATGGTVRFDFTDDAKEKFGDGTGVLLHYVILTKCANKMTKEPIKVYVNDEEQTLDFIPYDYSAPDDDLENDGNRVDLVYEMDPVEPLSSFTVSSPDAPLFFKTIRLYHGTQGIPTEVKGILSETSKTTEYYHIDGTRANANDSGLLIVRKADGSVRRIINPAR